MSESSERDGQLHFGASDLLDTGPEAAFDRITRLVARLVGVPVALISILDSDRQFFKSQLGLPEPWSARRETPLSHSFCRHVVASGEALVVEDARRHALVRDNPAIDDIGVVAYLGVPIAAPDGTLIGSLCAIDGTPRAWTPADRAAMEDLVAGLETELVLREEVRRRTAAEETARLVAREMEHRVKNLLATAQGIVWMVLRDTSLPQAEARRAILDRLAALGNAQSLLQRSGGAMLRELFGRELGPFVEAGQASLVGGELALSAEDGLAVGMIVHELATNAVKHGALRPGAEGTLRVEWQAQDAPARRLQFTWREVASAGGASAPEREPAGGGFGTQLLDLLIAKQMGGRLERDWTPRGLVFSADMPLRDEARRRQG
ncbi:GAF domain-containing protein [Aurantimonas sp. MSK8Z-1]|uniref:sensor histidine kinase n=1 Tax=Mangrovibrevibacter kandeliae TaxID=2968473 RepID=UPI00211949C1|nr:GAF domain-containing protein [Aurantimonas sp. MSK8Z-1]MCW4114919.1 GAF domain-containing protein [Aurantimonas sp. MSK8Z-1]